MKKTWIGITALMMAGWTQAENRIWTTPSGTVEGEYVKTVFDQVVLRDADGNSTRLPVAGLSEEDRKYVELANPPELKVDFLESAEQIFIRPSPIWTDNSPVTRLHHTFGARIKQLSSQTYEHKLTVEILAVSQQVYDTDKYHLVFRSRSDPFVLGKENERCHEFISATGVDITRFLLDGQYPRGERFAECLLIVRDERGEIIAYNSTKKWLYNSFEKLSALPVGAWFDKTGARVHPTSPKKVWID